jgi:Tfp pilus assembly protein PilF
MRHAASGCAARAPLLAVALVLAGCATAPPVPGLMDLLDRPAERALFDGMRAYDEGQYPAAETALRQALAQALSHPRDIATAHKLLAFIQCTSERVDACEAAFRAARQADPAFALTRAESGHPVWGPVYRRVSP